MILSEEQTQLKAKINGVLFAVIFDGKSQLGEPLALIVCFVDYSWSIKILLCMQLLVRSLSGEVTRELLSVITTEYGIVSSSFVAVLCDRARVNYIASTVNHLLSAAIMSDSFFLCSGRARPNSGSGFRYTKARYKDIKIRAARIAVCSK